VLTQLCFTLQLNPMSSTSQYNMSYHITVSNTTGYVDCTCLGMECVDTVLKHIYSSLDEMPMWVQERISLLMMLESKATLVNIGTKIDDYNFMVNGK
jgi:hypothetical protein